MFAKFYSPPTGTSGVNWSGLMKYVTDKVKSYSYTAKFVGAGDFTMVLHFIPEIISTLNINDIISYDGDWLIIKGIKYDETVGITLTGTDLNGILSQRLALPVNGEQDKVTGSTAVCIKHFLDNNIINPADIERKIPMKFYENNPTGNADDSYRSTLFENLADIVKTLCDWADVGYRVVGGVSENTAAVFEFRLVKGIDKSTAQNVRARVIFSPSWGNVIQQTFEHDISNMLNAVYGFDSGREVVGIGYRGNSYSGIARQEAMIDVSLEEGEDVGNIPKYALAATEDNDEVHNYTVIPTAQGYGTDYKLGDKVTVRDRYANVNYSAVISEVEKNYSGGQKSIKVSVGKPNQKLLNMIINNTVEGVQKKR